jgi:DNA-binding response OmpR family regulator
LIIEGSRGDYASFGEELRGKGYQVTKAPSGSAGLELLDSVNPHVIIIDAASLRTSGVRICQSFRISADSLPIILIVEKDITLPENNDANLVLRLPFTVQKLINRLMPITQQKKIFIACRPDRTEHADSAGHL